MDVEIVTIEDVNLISRKIASRDIGERVAKP
jgi:hypothetical protein